VVLFIVIYSFFRFLFSCLFHVWNKQ
jgi:hypothetical protein